MKLPVQVVELNDFEIQKVPQLAEYIRQLGKGFQWKREFPNGSGLKFTVDELTDDKIVVNGQIGAPFFRLMIKGDRISFTTQGADTPTQLFYDCCHIMSMKISDVANLYTPDVTVVDQFSTNIMDYYLVNSEDSTKIAESFEKSLKELDKAEKKYTSGMFYILLGSTEFGHELTIPAAKAFAESSCFDRVAAAFAFCRGRGVPIFYADGGIYYPLKDREFCQSIQEDFTRLLFKMVTRKHDVTINAADPDPT